MKCPYCSTIDTRVIDSRLNQTSDVTRRRRECPKCEGRFTTYEHVEEVMPLIIKKDGRREPYSRLKMLEGLKKSCQKRPVTSHSIDEAATLIEKRIQSYGLKEVPSRTIGQMVMIELHKLDTVAYIRFASVYREFKDVEEFVAELQEPPVAEDDPALLVFPFAATPPAVDSAGLSKSPNAPNSQKEKHHD